MVDIKDIEEFGYYMVDTCGKGLFTKDFDVGRKGQNQSASKLILEKVKREILKPIKPIK